MAIAIGPLDGEAEATRCATIMSTSDPWITLGRGFDKCRAMIADPTREVYVARSGGELAGFLILTMQGAFRGYIQTIAVDEKFRGHGVGTALIAFAEQRIFAESPNVFMCVSSFNERAKTLYLRLGYEVIGEIVDYVVRGYSEWLLRKSVAPMDEFAPKKLSTQ
jgi:[ribosomal protein S18]-alanine N-acetyltransferase